MIKKLIRLGPHNQERIYTQEEAKELFEAAFEDYFLTFLESFPASKSKLSEAALRSNEGIMGKDNSKGF